MKNTLKTLAKTASAAGLAGLLFFSGCSAEHNRIEKGKQAYVLVGGYDERSLDARQNQLLGGQFEQLARKQGCNLVIEKKPVRVSHLDSSGNFIYFMDDLQVNVNGGEVEVYSGKARLKDKEVVWYGKKMADVILDKLTNIDEQTDNAKRTLHDTLNTVYSKKN
jgi:hypothetical protein